MKPNSSYGSELVESIAGLATGCFASLVAAFALVACAGSTPTRYYALDSVAPASTGASSAAAIYSGPPIEVRAVQVPPDADRQELIRQLGGGEILVRDFDHWAAPIGRLARQVLSEDLASRLPKDKVVFPGAAGPELRAGLSVDILSFRMNGGGATMLASWSVRWPSSIAAAPASAAASASNAAASASNAPSAPVSMPALRGASLRLDVPAGESAADTALAWSRAMAMLADSIAADLAH